MISFLGDMIKSVAVHKRFVTTFSWTTPAQRGTADRVCMLYLPAASSLLPSPPLTMAPLTPVVLRFFRVGDVFCIAFNTFAGPSIDYPCCRDSPELAKGPPSRSRTLDLDFILLPYMLALPHAAGALGNDMPGALSLGRRSAALACSFCQ